MKRYSHLILAAVLAVLGVLLASIDAQAMARSRGAVGSALARHSLYGIPFIAGLLFPRYFWLTALVFWLPQAIVWYVRVQDPLVPLGILLAFVVIAVSSVSSAAIGIVVRDIVRRLRHEAPQET
jgi:hypothetical protein